MNSINPGVGHYNWQLVRNKVKSLKFMQQNTSTTQQKQKNLHQKYVNKVLGESTDPQKEIGPGKYDPALM